MKRYSAKSHDTGITVTIRANQAGHAAHLCGVHWYAPHELRARDTPGALRTEHHGTFDLIDPVTGDMIDRVTVTPYEAAQGVQRSAGVTEPVRPRMVTLDEPTVTTLRALGDGNLSLGIRRAATLIGGGGA